MDSKKIFSAKEMHAAYMRAYRKQHPEKIRRYNEAYWQRKADLANREGWDDEEKTGRV